jgi:hypothetical protein
MLFDENCLILYDLQKQLFTKGEMNIDEYLWDKANVNIHQYSLHCFSIITQVNIRKLTEKKTSKESEQKQNRKWVQ